MLSRYYFRALLAICALASALAGKVEASPWIEANDAYLRASIEQLADAGYLRGHVNTYPLMWSGIARDLRRIDPAWLNDDELHAYYRVSAALDFAQMERVNGVRTTLNSERARQNGYADMYREHASLVVSRTFTNEHTAARIQTNVRGGSVEHKSYTFEGSYLATTLGNWAFSVDQMPVWWGPGQDNALVMSTNARPLQGFRLNRLEDNPSNLPVLRWAGHWHATAFAGRTQSAGPLGDQEIAGARLGIRPLPALSIGASTTLQAGDNLGRRNHIVGADVRLALPLAVTLYAEAAQRSGSTDVVAFEGASRDSRYALTIGVSHSIMLGQNLQQFFAEHTDVPAFFYDDNTDPAGYRRWGLNMGAAIDQDVESLTLGYRFQTAHGTGWQMRLRDQRMGASNRLVAMQHDIEGRDFDIKRRMVDVNYQRPFAETLLTIGVTYSYDVVRENFLNSMSSESSEHDLAVRASWEFRF